MKSSKPTKKDKETPNISAAGRKKKNTPSPAALLNVTSCSGLPLEVDDMLSPLTVTGHTSMNDSIEESTYDWENASIGDDTVARESNDERIKLLQDEDEKDVGDGGDSDGEGDGYECVTSFREGMKEVERERIEHDAQEIEHDVEVDDDDAFVCNKTENVLSTLFGAPKGWSPPGPPEDWNPKVNSSRGEPPMDDVDNPGGWSSFTFRPMFQAKGGQYIGHAMPAGATVVPKSEETWKRQSQGFEFFYNGWKQENPTRENCRFGASRDELFPPDRQVHLDINYLKKMGLTRQRMIECDALFFYQLLLPICDPAMSGINEDPRMTYYEKVATNTNMYAYGVKKRGGTRGHLFRPTDSQELLVWDGIVCRNLNNNIAESWMMNQSNTYDREISEAMHYRRWIDIKACLKQNEFWTEKKRGEEGYDPTQKYRLVWDVMTFNMNQIIEKGGLDVTMDETTWPNSSYADVHGRLSGKKTDKGGQHVLLLDSKRRYMYAWSPRHKFFPITPPFTATGPAEVVRMIEIITPLIKGASKESTDKRKQIFDEPVHLAMDNFFSGDEVLSFLGERGWKATMTCRRDRLPRGVPKAYFNFIKAAPVNARSKAARFEQPIIAVRNVKQPQNKTSTEDAKVQGKTPVKDDEPVLEKKDYVICHVSFQSTGGTNITSVNAFSSVELYVREKNKGKGNQKRTWGIEMNEARETYLKNYSAVDKIDQMLLGWDVTYKSWRWWHAPTRHAKAIAMSMAYSLYLHCAEGSVDPDWKVVAVSGPKFRQKMSLQMVQYRPSEMKYPGDSRMRMATQMNKRKRGGLEGSLVECDDHIKRVSYSQYLDKKRPRKGKESRFCADNLTLLKKHLSSMKKVHGASCSMCGKLTYMECQLCQKHVCFKSGKGAKTLSCCIDFHDDLKYGLSVMDRVELFGVQKSKFKKAPAPEVRKNKIHMRDLMMKYHRDIGDKY